ncbi:hypothetical protein ONS95_011556 [Cadophora gregata]|uniref:uncharacterized protein n=1 Tax=Cadophora gregata TaxID=51156 RepID=UPI0026DB226D|nr:uncharacterized protein ONS95_011556 [Cadophora gregata]KAK0120149.1 hypothetical protein ONS95_011556 [Cadophora gregata]
MYLQREFNARRADVYNVEGERFLPGARLAPVVEAALLRGRRRRRRRREEMRRREMKKREMKRGRRGLGGLR